MMVQMLRQVAAVRSICWNRKLSKNPFISSVTVTINCMLSIYTA